MVITKERFISAMCINIGYLIAYLEYYKEKPNEAIIAVFSYLCVKGFIGIGATFIKQ